MSTYDLKHVITDYANGTLTPEMAVGHALQHINKLYEVQIGANPSHSELRSKVDTLEYKISTLQATVDCLKALVDKILPKP